MRKRYIVFILFILIIFILSGCGVNTFRFKESYSKYDEDKEIYIISEDAFKDIEKLDDNYIDENIPPELYIAKFGYREIKDFEPRKVYRPDGPEAPYIVFVDKDGKGHIVYKKADKLAIGDIPRGIAESNYLLKEFENVNDENIEEFIEVFEYDTSKIVFNEIEGNDLKINDYTLLNYEVIEDEEGNRILYIYTNEGEKLHYMVHKDGGEGQGREKYDVKAYMEQLRNKIINDFIKQHNLESRDYKVGKINEDDKEDFVLLCVNEDGYDGYIYVIDGNTREILCKQEVFVGSQMATIDIIGMKEKGQQFIEYFTHDGGTAGGLFYVFGYEDNQLVDISNKIDEIKSLQTELSTETVKGLPYVGFDIYTKSLYYYFPSLNKIYWISLSKEAGEEYYKEYIEAYYNGEDFNNLIYYKDGGVIIDEDNRITFISYLVCTPISNSEMAEIRRTYRIEDSDYILTDVNIQVYDYDSKVQVVNGLTEEVKNELFKNSNIIMNEDTVSRLFKLTKEDVIKLHGEPKSFEGEGNADIVFEDIIYCFEGGNQHPWGPSSIVFTGGKHEIFGIKIGMTTEEVKKILGDSIGESDAEDEEGSYLTYNISDHNLFMEVQDGKIVYCIVKAKGL